MRPIPVPPSHLSLSLLITLSWGGEVLAGPIPPAAALSPTQEETPQARTLVDDPAICLDCITVSNEVMIGEENGPGFLERSGVSMALDGLGRYWVLQREGAKVFAPNGEFLRAVGREGEGPGEFRTVTCLTSDPEGFVHIFDGENVRVTSFNHDFTVRSTAQTPGPVSRAEILPDGRTYVANMLVTRAANSAKSLHIVNMADSRILASFALAPEGERLVTPTLLSTDEKGRIYAVQRDSYALDIWSPNGERLGSFERVGLFEPIRPPGLRTRRPGDPPELRSFVAAIRFDAHGLLWVSAWILREDWRDNLIRVERPGRPPAYTRGAPGTIYKNVVEVIDVGQGKVIARTELGDPFIVGFLSDGRIHGSMDTDGDWPVAAVARLEFNPKVSQRREE